MAITKKAEYAISALTDLADNGGQSYIAAKTIAERQGIPINLIAQLLATLSRAGWVEGVRGPSGGMRLVRDPARISLKEVIELFEGPLGLTRCLVQSGECSNQGNCPLQNVWAEAQAKMLEVLDGKTIQDLVEARRAMHQNGHN